MLQMSAKVFLICIGIDVRVHWIMIDFAACLTDFCILLQSKMSAT